MTNFKRKIVIWYRLIKKYIIYQKIEVSFLH